MNRLSKIPTPVIFAHRGASAYAPENTLAAFRLAKLQGAPAIELDAKLTADKEVVVIHDATVDRTTNGTGKVNELTFEEIRNMDAGVKFAPEFQGEKIPSLKEVFEDCSDSLFINVELTNYSSPRDELPQKVARLVLETSVEEKVLFSSFNLFNLIKIKKLLPQCEVAILALPGWKGFAARSLPGRLASPKIVHPFLGDASAAFIRRQKKHDRRVHVWTVNKQGDMRRLFLMGVEGIFTDAPNLACQLIREK
jgi:glycerophosphoryl diester phosphodiesterase